VTDLRRCTRCDALIMWVVTHGGHRRAINPNPHPDGVILLETVGGELRGRVLTGDELPAQQAAHVPHDRTCPRSPEAARRRAAAVPKCRACAGTPDERLDAVWAAAGHHYHVNCAPPSGGP
jgi:hypothetical protein